MTHACVRHDTLYVHELNRRDAEWGCCQRKAPVRYALTHVQLERFLCNATGGTSQKYFYTYAGEWRWCCCQREAPVMRACIYRSPVRNTSMHRALVAYFLKSSSLYCSSVSRTSVHAQVRNTFMCCAVLVYVYVPVSVLCWCGVYIYIYTYIWYICRFRYNYLHVKHKCLYLYIYTHIRSVGVVCMYIHKYRYRYLQVYMLHLSIHIYIRIYHTYMYMYIYTYIYLYIHIDKFTYLWYSCLTCAYRTGAFTLASHIFCIWCVYVCVCVCACLKTHLKAYQKISVSFCDIGYMTCVHARVLLYLKKQNKSCTLSWSRGYTYCY